MSEKRVNPETGVHEEQNVWGTWKPTKNDSGREERVNPETGAHEEQNVWGTWKPTKNDSGREERVNPETGVYEEQNVWGTWKPTKNDSGHEERVNPATGIYEEQNVWGTWKPTKSGRQSQRTPPPRRQSGHPSSDSTNTSDGDASSGTRRGGVFGYIVVAIVILFGIVAIIKVIRTTTQSQPPQPFKPTNSFYPPSKKHVMPQGPLPTETPFPVLPPIPILPEHQARSYDGKGHIYKVPELKTLVGKHLTNAWLYGDFCLWGQDGNTLRCHTVGIVLYIPQPGSTMVEIEFERGVSIAPNVLEAVEHGLVACFRIEKRSPLELIAVEQIGRHFVVYARSPASFAFRSGKETGSVSEP